MKNQSVRYKAIKNEEIAEAVLELAAPVLGASEGDESVLAALVEIAVKAWNISLFSPSGQDGDYSIEIDAVIPGSLTPERKIIFRKFMKFLIDEKRKKYPDYMKGIRKYDYRTENGRIVLTVDALPVKPVVAG